MSSKIRLQLTPAEKKELEYEVAEAKKELDYAREIAKKKLGIINDDKNENNNENSFSNSNQNIKYLNTLRKTALAAVRSTTSSALQKIMTNKNNNDKKNLIKTNHALIQSINKTIKNLKGIEKQKKQLTIDEQLELNKILNEVRGELDSLPKPKETRGGKTKTKKGKKNKTKKRK